MNVEAMARRQLPDWIDDYAFIADGVKLEEMKTDGRALR